MNGYHGIIFAYSAAPELRELVSMRTAASLPFCGRYRLIDFALSSMHNAGIHNVGIIMQRDYQSLLDHIGGGKAWDMSRRKGGLRILPPFGLPEYHKGDYTGTIEALNAVSTYIHDIKENAVVLMLGNLCANIDLSAALEQHRRSGADITAICTKRDSDSSFYRYVTGEDGCVERMLFDSPDSAEGFASLECYVISKDVLVHMMDDCRKRNLYRFHRDAMADFLAAGGKMGVCIHDGYAAAIRTVNSYYKANMDMLCAEYRREIFPASRPVQTKTKEEVSTYYGEDASAVNCLVADNCIIEGRIENCIVSSGARIGKGAVLRNCIIMRGASVGEGCELDYIIADKKCSFTPGTKLTGNKALPVVVPKGTKI